MDVRPVLLLGLVAMVSAMDKGKGSGEEVRPQGVATRYRDEGGYREEREYRGGRYPPHGPYYMGYDPYRRLEQYKETYDGGLYFYGGRYSGRCYENGLYYMDQQSFVLCSNGNAYVQPCAPGTQNSGQASFRPGYYYGYSDFCDINLVDRGFGYRPYRPRTETRYGGDEKRQSSYEESQEQKRSR